MNKKEIGKILLDCIDSHRFEGCLKDTDEINAVFLIEYVCDLFGLDKNVICLVLVYHVHDI